MTGFRKEMVLGHVAELRKWFPPQPPIDMREQERSFRHRQYADVVRNVRDHLKLKLPVRIGYVNRGGPENAPAFIRLPTRMPLLGSRAFEQLQVTIFLRKDFLATSDACAVTAAVAHEFSHVLLEATRHPLRNSEEAVDLTAMMLGFREAYYRISERKTSVRLGYLRRDETRLARALILGGGPAIQWLRRQRELTFVAGCVLALLIAAGLDQQRGVQANESACAAKGAAIDEERVGLNLYDAEAVERFNARVEKFNASCTDK